MKYLLILITTLMLLSCSEEVKTPLDLNQGTITTGVHKNNTGKIAFMNDWIALDKFSQNHFIDSLSLSNTSDFGMRMFLDKTLTYYLNQLEPNLAVRELCDNGNFQLTFFVDEKQFYKHNLPTGAGSCEYKNDTTAYGVPLVNKKNPDHWGRFLWMKFMKKHNGQEALENGSHKLKIEVRAYIEHNELKVGDIIAQGEIQLTMLEKEVDESQTAIQPIAPTDKWTQSEDSYDKILIKQLNRKIAQEYYQDITSIVVIKDNELLIEEYFNGTSRNSTHDMRSVGKTLASTVMGIALKDGHITVNNQTLDNFYDLKSYENYSASKEKVTLESLLTMASGIEGTDMDPKSAGNEENMYPTSDWVKFGLDLPMDKNKTIGENWDYFTAGAVILGDVLNKSVPEGLEKYAEEKLFKPLGINNYKWQYTPTNVPNTAGGFEMSSLDNARWGQLYLDGGKYSNEQILPKAWVEISLKKHLAIPNRENEYYGYLLWNKTYKVNGKEYESFYASGNGGNRIMVFKEIGVVIVITATAYGQPYAHHQADEIIEKYLLSSLF